MGKRIIRLEVGGQLCHRDIALRTVSAACRLVFAARAKPCDSQSFVYDVVSAVSEAFNNIAVHGYRGRPSGPVEITVAASPQRLAVELRDHGRSFDPRTAAPPDLAALPESGMGVYIMTQMMDELEYRPGSPNVLRLVKRLT